MAMSGYVVPLQWKTLPKKAEAALVEQLVRAGTQVEGVRVRVVPLPGATLLELRFREGRKWASRARVDSPWAPRCLLAAALGVRVFELHASSRERRVFGWLPDGALAGDWSSNAARISSWPLGELEGATGVAFSKVAKKTPKHVADVEIEVSRKLEAALRAEAEAVRVAHEAARKAQARADALLRGFQETTQAVFDAVWPGALGEKRERFARFVAVEAPALLERVGESRVLSRVDEAGVKLVLGRWHDRGAGG